MCLRESEQEHRVKMVKCDGLADYQGLLCSQKAEAGISANVCACVSVYTIRLCVCESVFVYLHTPHSRMERASTSAMTSR